MSIKLKIFQIRNILLFYLTASKVPEHILKNRKLFKKAVITYPYNCGDTSRIKGFKDFITESMLKEGRGNLIDKNVLESFAMYANNFFLSKVKQGSLKECYKYLQIVNNNMANYLKREEVKPFQIKHKFLDWDFLIMKKEIYRLRTAKHRFNVALSRKEYNKDEMMTAFSSISILCIDAHIVHSLYALVSLINKDLEKNKLPIIQIWCGVIMIVII